MTGNDLAGLIAVSVLGLIVTVLAVLLLLGKGAFLIAGYNMLPKSEQDKYDVKALCKFMGKIVLPIGIFIPVTALGAIHRIEWAGYAYVGGVLALVAFALIYCNTRNRFKK